MRKLLLLAALSMFIITVNAQVIPPTFEKVSDSLWKITEPTYGGKLITREAVPIDHLQWTSEINKRIRTAGILGSASFGLGAGAFVCEVASVKGKNLQKASMLLGIGAVGLGFAAAISLIGEKVYVTPEGVILKLNHPKRSTNVQQRQ